MNRSIVHDQQYYFQINFKFNWKRCFGKYSLKLINFWKFFLKNQFQKEVMAPIKAREPTKFEFKKIVELYFFNPSLTNFCLS